MPESGFLVPLKNRMVLMNPDDNPEPIKSEVQDATEDANIRKQPSPSSSLLLDGDRTEIDIDSWTAPRFHKVPVTKPRVFLTEEYPQSLARSRTSGTHSATVRSAILSGNVECLKELYRSGQVSEVDKRGNTTLHIAAKHGQVRPLRWLLLHSHIPAMTKNKRGETCGHQAAIMGHVKCLKAVLSVKKETPLSLVSERDNRGQTVLHHAVLGGNKRAVEWLVKEFGKDLCLMKSTDGTIALHMAAATGHREIVRMLVNSCPKSVNSRDKVGASPLFYAAQEGHLDVVRCMIHGGNGDINTAKTDGTALLHISALRGHVQILDFLLLKLGNEALLKQSQDGSTLLHYAAGNGSDHVIKHLQQLPKFAEALELVDVNDSTPAHDAAEGGHVTCLKLLLDAGLELFSPDKDGETPYSLALRSTNPQCVLFVRSRTERDYHSEGDVLSGDDESPPISGVMGIRALSREDSYNFKKAGSLAVTFPSHKKLGRRKMGHVMSTHWPDTDSLSRKSHSEDSDTLSSTEDSKKGRFHRQKQQSKGLFRGEFILMEAQPRDDMSSRERRSIMSSNGYLYAQKNRPRPITLPFQVDECPTRIHQMESSDDLDIDDIDRFNEEKTPLVVIQEYNGFRHGSRSGSLDEIKEEEEDLDSASVMAFRYDMLNLSRPHNRLEGEYLAQRGLTRRRTEDPRSTLESQSSGISVFHNEHCRDRLEESPYGQLGRPKLSLSEESGASCQYDSGCKSSFSSSNSESEDHNKGHRHRDSDGFSSFSPESTSSSFRIMTNKEQMRHSHYSQNAKQRDSETNRETKTKPCKSDSLPSSTSSRDSLGESSQENAAFEFDHNAFSGDQMFPCGSSISPMEPIEQYVKDSFEINKHSYKNSSGNVQNILDSSNSRIVQIRTNHGKGGSSNSDSQYETGSVAGSDSMYTRVSPNVIHVGDPSSNYTTVIILTSDESCGNTRIEVNPQCGSTEDLSSASLPSETCDPKDSTNSYQAKMAHFLKTVQFEKDRNSVISESSLSAPLNGVDSTPGRKPSDIISSSINDTQSNKSPSPPKPKVPPPPRINRTQDNNTIPSYTVPTQSISSVLPNVQESETCNETKTFTEVNHKDVKDSHKGSGCRIKELQQVLMKQANPFCTVIPSKKSEPQEINKRPRATSAPQVKASAAVLELAARKASVISNESFVVGTSLGECKRPPAPPPPPQNHLKPPAPLPPTSVPSAPPPRPPPPMTSPPPRPPPPVLPPSFKYSPPSVPPPPPPPPYASSTLPLVNRKSDYPKPSPNKNSDGKTLSDKSSNKTSPVDDDTKVRMADVKNMIQRGGTLPSDRTRNFGSLPDLKNVGKRDKHSKTSKSGEGRKERKRSDENPAENRTRSRTTKHHSNTPSERTSASGSSTRSPKPRHKTKRSGDSRTDSLRRGDSPRSHDSPRRPKRNDSLRRRDKNHDGSKPRNSSRTNSPRTQERSRRDSPKMRDKKRHNSRESRSYDSNVSQQRYDSPRSNEERREDSPRPRENKGRESPRPRENDRNDSPRSHDRKPRISPPNPERCDSPLSYASQRHDSPRPRLETQRHDSPRPRLDTQRHDSPRPRLDKQRHDSPKPRGNKQQDNPRNPERHENGRPSNVKECDRRRESPRPRDSHGLVSPHVRDGSRPRSKQRHDSPRPRSEKPKARTDSPRHQDRDNEKPRKSGSPRNNRRHSPNKHRNKHSNDSHVNNTREQGKRKLPGEITERTQRHNAIKVS